MDVRDIRRSRTDDPVLCGPVHYPQTTTTDWQISRQGKVYRRDNVGPFLRLYICLAIISEPLHRPGCIRSNNQLKHMAANTQTN